MISTEDVKQLIYNVSKEEVTTTLEYYSEDFNVLEVKFKDYKIRSFHENYLTLDQLQFSIKEAHLRLLRILLKKAIE
jgi:hypothetical protein